MNIKLFHFGSILLSVIGVAVQGCSMAPQTVRLAPQVQVSQSDVGKGKVVGLDVSDARGDKKAGIIGDEKIKFVTISAEDKSPSPVYREAADALTKLGFKVQPASSATERVLRIELEQLEYSNISRSNAPLRSTPKPKSRWQPLLKMAQIGTSESSRPRRRAQAARRQVKARSRAR